MNPPPAAAGQCRHEASEAASLIESAPTVEDLDWYADALAREYLEAEDEIDRIAQRELEGESAEEPGRPEEAAPRAAEGGNQAPARADREAPRGADREGLTPAAPATPAARSLQQDLTDSPAAGEQQGASPAETAEIADAFEGLIPKEKSAARSLLIHVSAASKFFRGRTLEQVVGEFSAWRDEEGMLSSDIGGRFTLYDAGASPSDQRAIGYVAYNGNVTVTDPDFNVGGPAAALPAPTTLAGQLASLSESDIDALVDDAVEATGAPETEKPAKKRATSTKPKKAGAAPKPRKATSKPERIDTKDREAVRRTSGDIAKSLGYNLSGAGRHALEGLTALFGGSGKLSSGLSFDEETYAKAKPHFQAMLKDAQAAGRDLADFVRSLVGAFGSGVKPYLRRFAADLRAQDDGTVPSQQLPDGGPQQDFFAAGGGNSESLDAGVAEEGQGDAGGRDVSGTAELAGAEGTGGAEQPGQRPPRAPRNSGAVRPEPGAAGGDLASDFDLADKDIGSGGLKRKYADNIKAIRILKAMDAEQRLATPEERDAMRIVLSSHLPWRSSAETSA